DGILLLLCKRVITGIPITHSHLLVLLDWVEECIILLLPVMGLIIIHPRLDLTLQRLPLYSQCPFL
ncbi:hypothetical protein PIB30_046454, partial [Stylosanthes scabra]|nr:hypothetical protein [Stylosanthes scabra]